MAPDIMFPSAQWSKDRMAERKEQAMNDDMSDIRDMAINEAARVAVLALRVAGFRMDRAAEGELRSRIAEMLRNTPMSVIPSVPPVVKLGQGDYEWTWPSPT